MLAYFWFSGFAAFAEGPWLRYVAGALLILLGIHEYRHGGHDHAADDGHGHDHDHRDRGDPADDHDHRDRDHHEHAHRGRYANGGTHDHDHPREPAIDDRSRLERVRADYSRSRTNARTSSSSRPAYSRRNSRASARVTYWRPSIRVAIGW